MGMGHRMLPIAFSPTDPRCHSNEIWDKIGYNSACVRDICEIFASVGEFSEMGHQMLLTEFYPNRPLFPWQQNLRQNGLYLSLYNKYHQDPCIWRRCGLRVWQLDDVSLSLPQPSMISSITSSSVVGAAAVVDISNVLFPIGDILLCLKKVKGKDTDPAIALFTCARLIPRLLAIKQQI